MSDNSSGVKWSSVSPLYVPKEQAQTKTEGVEKSKSFDLNTSKMEVGTGKNAPKQSTSWKDAIRNFFSNLAKTVSGWFDPAVRQAKQEQRLAEKLSNAPGLPQGLQIGHDGTIDCRIPIKLHDRALIQVESSDHAAPITPGQFMVTLAGEHMSTNRTVDMPNGESIQMNGEVCRDFGRMNIEIPTPTGPFFTPDGKGVEAESRLPQSMQHLKAFAGSDNATRVLSSITNQYTIRNMIRVLDGGDGDISLGRLANSKLPVTVDLPNGTTLDMDKPPQLSDAHFKLSKTEDGNFKIDLEWPTFVTTYSSIDEGGKVHDGPIRVPEGHALKQTVTLSLVIDANEAAQGRIVLLDEGRPMMSVVGKIDVEATLGNM